MGRSSVLAALLFVNAKPTSSTRDKTKEPKWIAIGDYEKERKAWMVFGGSLLPTYYLGLYRGSAYVFME